MNKANIHRTEKRDCNVIIIEDIKTSALTMNRSHKEKINKI
jgi:hypothetical protein